MINLWYLNTKELRPEDVEDQLMALPAEIGREIMRFRFHEDRRLKLFGKLMVRKYYSNREKEFDWNNWKLTPGGKPYLAGAGRFNISHSGEYVLAAFSDKEVGADIERITDFDAREISHYFHPEEQAYIENSTDTKGSFFKLWTRKEAYLKATGIGILEGLHHENCLPDHLEDKGGWYLHSFSFLPAYQVSLCTHIPDCSIRIQEVFPEDFKLTENQQQLR